MSDILILDDARARGISLPADDDVAQDILDETEAWLLRRIGAFSGTRTERFYVGLARSTGRLGLRRFTDAITVTDGGVAVAADHVRLIDGSSIVRTYTALGRWWNGPHVEVAYEPSDALEVQRVLYDLLALDAPNPDGLQSETIGDYAYTRAAGNSAVAAQKAALVASLLPHPDELVTLSSRPLTYGDPVINRAEPND